MSVENEMPQDEETELLHELVKDSHILTPVVLIGASALIPVPFLDDIAKAYLEKSLFASLAEREGLELSKDERTQLTQEPNSGCWALGCLGSAILYLPKKFFRKIFFFLEIKRAIDQSTTALAEAFLFRLTLQRELWKPGSELQDAECVRRAIKGACRSQGVKPLETAIRHGFEGAKGSFGEFASKFAGRTGSDEEEMAKAVESLEREKEEELAGITRKLSVSLEDVSGSYLQKFVVNFQNQLAQERAKPDPA